MEFQRWNLFILLLCFINLHVYLFVEAQNDVYVDCSVDGNYTTNSAYERNLNSLLSTLPSNMGTFGFYNSSIGIAPDRVTVSAICRADVQPQACQSCVTNARRRSRQNCPMRRDVIVYRNFCTFRYSNESFIGTYDDRVGRVFWSNDNITSVQQFNQDLNRLIVDLRNRASDGGFPIKMAAGNVSGPDSLTIYSLVQCTPDISNDDCRSCLGQAARDIPLCCNGRDAVTNYYPNCMLVFDTYGFYNSTRIGEVEAMARAPIPAPPSVFPLAPSESPPSLGPLTPSPSRRQGASTTIIIIVVVVLVACMFVVAAVVIVLRRRMMKRIKGKTKSKDDEISIEELMQYEFDEIKVATNNFSETNKLGEGGFGTVYKGILKDGKEIAVKRLFTSSSQVDAEFKNEVMLVARLRHRNLVRLFGFAIEKTERLLIFEFFKNGSLDNFIFDPAKRPAIGWDRRYNIIKGIARGLVYLHEDAPSPIIHRDLKASNILIDDQINPKIADFGTARLFVRDKTAEITSKIIGTHGYMAPEYAVYGQLSVKMDVYSFGILIFEIVSGWKYGSAINGESGEDILGFAWRKWKEGTLDSMIDPTMKISSGSLLDIRKCIHIGLLCVQQNASDRPTMASVVLMLGNSSITLPLPSRPAFSVPGMTEIENQLAKEIITP